MGTLRTIIFPAKMVRKRFDKRTKVRKKVKANRAKLKGELRAGKKRIHAESLTEVRMNLAKARRRKRSIYY